MQSRRLARVTNVAGMPRKEAVNYCGEVHQEDITLIDEQIEHLYLDRFDNNPEWKKWQEAIDQVNGHPSGKNWHILSIAVHLHSHQADVLRTISEIRREAMSRKVPLPENIFKDAIRFLTEINLYQE